MSDSVPTTEVGPATPAAGDRPGGVVAVLSQHSYLALQMRRAGFDILEGKDIDDVAKAAASVDVVVVDLVAVDGKRAVVARLSTAVDPRIPVVLISADAVDLALLGAGRSVHIVVPPVRAEDVISQVRSILETRAADNLRGAHGFTAEPAEKDAAKIGLRAGPRAAKAAAKRAQARARAKDSTATVTEMHDRKRLPPRRTAVRRIDERAGDPQPTGLPLSAHHSEPVPVLPAPSDRPPAHVASAATQVSSLSATPPPHAPPEPPAAPAVATATRPSRTTTSSRTPATGRATGANGAATTHGVSSAAVLDLTALPAPVLDWRVVANQLTHAVQSIPAVSVVAQTMADELAAISRAHVAVMVRDFSGAWAVEAGVGLRSFEWAQTLQDDDWLVWAGRDQHPSLMVMDTDVVRGDLAGAPLASRLQLVRTHSTKAPFFVCAGWETDEGNDTGRVALVVEAVRRHGSEMADALGVRSLAQWLSAHVGGDTVRSG
ncbi:MAG: hypothetical protein ACJ71T_06555 [Actinomycetales bacterium]